MTIEQLEQFMEVARLKNYTKAAESLFISHSTISRNISALERELGTALLYRDTRMVKLTTAGEIMEKECKRFSKEWKDVLRQVKSAGNGSFGRLAIASMNFYDEQLFQVIKNFCIEYPDVHFLMQYYRPERVEEEVRLGKADIGIAFSFEVENQDSEEYEQLAIFKENMCVVTSPDHRLAKCESIWAKDLMNEKIFSLENIAYDFINKINLQILGNDLQLSTQLFESLESMLLHIRMGQGVSLLPRPIAIEHRSGCAVVELKDLDAHFDVVLYWKPDNMNQSLKLFVDYIYERYNQLVRD